MTSSYDAIVVGGGHNGLVAAAYLAKRGARTLVLEARHKTGGAADTMAPWPEAPGFKVTTLSYVMSLMPDTIIRDLRLAEHGYRTTPVGPYFVPFPDGRCIIRGEGEGDYEQFAKFSKRDADALERWEAWIGGLADVLGPLLMTTPPRVGSRSPRDLTEQLRLAWRYRGLDVPGVADVTRLMTMSIVDHPRPVLRVRPGEDRPGPRRTDRDLGRAARAGDRLRDGPPLDRRRRHGSHRGVGHAGGRHGRGGGGARGERAVLRGRRAHVGPGRAGSLTRDGAVRGVALAGGEEIVAPIVVAATHPQITFLRQVEPGDLPAEFVDDIRNWRSRSGTVKINLALDRAPVFTAAPEHEDLTGGFELAHSIAYLERAFEEARAGRPATAPFSDGVMPTFHDPSMAPEGKHVVSLFTQWCPAEYADAPHRRGPRRLRRPCDRRLRRARAGVRRLGAAPTGDRPVRDAARVGPRGRQHLPRRALRRAALPHAARARLRGLPHPDPRPLPVLQRHPRGRRRDRDPRLQLRAGDRARPQTQTIREGGQS